MKQMLHKANVHRTMRHYNFAIVYQIVWHRYCTPNTHIAAKAHILALHAPHALVCPGRPTFSERSRKLTARIMQIPGEHSPSRLGVHADTIWINPLTRTMKVAGAYAFYILNNKIIAFLDCAHSLRWAENQCEAEGGPWSISRAEIICAKILSLSAAWRALQPASLWPFLRVRWGPSQIFASGHLHHTNKVH